MKVIGRKENQMEKECKLTFREIFIKVNLLMGNLMVMEHIRGQMENNIKAIGRKGKQIKRENILEIGKSKKFVTYYKVKRINYIFFSF